MSAKQLAEINAELNALEWDPPLRELTYVRNQSRKPKPGPTAKARAKRKRADGQVAAAVREKCVERDGHCRIMRSGSTLAIVVEQFGACDGPSEWAHMHSRRRSQTKNQAPVLRHDTAHSFMACRRHHDRYDGRDSPRLFVTALTRSGADGALKVRSGK